MAIHDETIHLERIEHVEHISGHKQSKSERAIRRINDLRAIGASCEAPSESNSSILNLNPNFKLPPHLPTAKRRSIIFSVSQAQSDLTEHAHYWHWQSTQPLA